MKKFAIVLSGCGVYDGAEIHEAVSAMLAVCRSGHEYQVFAPDVAQHHVINHLTGEVMSEKRNVMVEAARIARGNVKSLPEFKPSDYDALLFAGGFGAAKNLSDFAFKGNDFSVTEPVCDVIKAMHAAGKPIGAMCIAPVLVAYALDNVELTMGGVSPASEAAEKHGAKHIVKSHGEVAVDTKNKIVTTPCYMLEATIAQVAEGAENLVDEMLKLM